MSNMSNIEIAAKLRKPLFFPISSKTKGVIYVTKKATLFSVTSASTTIFSCSSQNPNF